MTATADRFDDLLEVKDDLDVGRMVLDLDPGLVALLRARRLFANVRWQEYVPDDQADREDVDELEVAEASSSQFAHDYTRHAILFDIDVPAVYDGTHLRVRSGCREWAWSTQGAPAWLIPSSTEGHSHFYVDCNLPWDTVLRILKQFERAGVVEAGYRQVSEKRGFTALRLPWVRK